MIIWTPGDTGRGSPAKVARENFAETRVSSRSRRKSARDRLAKDLVYLDAEANPCQPRAVSDEEWSRVDCIATVAAR